MTKEQFVKTVNSLIEKIEWEEKFSNTFESLFEDTTVIATKVWETATIGLTALINNITNDWKIAETEADYYSYECNFCRFGEKGEVDDYTFSNAEEFYDYLVANYEE